MNERKIVPMTPELQARWEQARKETEAELPDLMKLGGRLREASLEETVSGHLRRAIHRSSRELAEIAAAAGISLLQLNEFLSGERTLRSDVLDRLGAAVDFTRALSQQ
ncbi:MAG: hypothetical protein K8T91_27805 [Planctomycetes bacterium]|nr:hypothetical protein [Planctomycetota bacterium]